MPAPGTLFVVATPIGNLEDITLRALRVLREAAVIAAEDTRRTSHLLTRHGIHTPTTSLHEHNEAAKTAAVLTRLARGEDVALVSDAGTPTIADPGRALIEAAHAAGIRVEPIPGPNAAVAAVAVSGFAAETFTFLGFPPTRSKDRNAWFDKLAAVDGIAVLYEAPHRVRATLQQIQEHVGDVEAFAGRELTKAHEQLVKGPISKLLAAFSEPRGEFTIVLNIGQLIDNNRALDVDPDEIRLAFHQLTKSGGLDRRGVIARLSQSYRIPRNQLYKMLEAGKK